MPRARRSEFRFPTEAPGQPACVVGSEEGSVRVRQAPEEIPDEEHERLIERVCAIDVAKASGKVCTRLPSQGGAGRRVSRVWDVAATTDTVIELADQLVAAGIEKVTVESTSDYWRMWFYLLEAAGLDVQLVNARDVKNTSRVDPKQTN